MSTFSLDGGPDMLVQALSGALQIDSVAAGAHTLTATSRAATIRKSRAPMQRRSRSTSVLPDTTKPVVVITAPRDGDTVSATLTISANAVDDIAVAGVQFKLDGVALGSEDTSAPYSVSWNTTTATNGAHVLTAVARDTVQQHRGVA